MPFSENVRQIEASSTIAVAARTRELRAQGRDVLDLGVGEPDFRTPDFIARAGIAAIEQGLTHYPPVPGIAPLRDAIARSIQSAHGKAAEAAGVVVTSGRYDEPPRGIAKATISLRILRTRPPVEDGAEHILAWVAAADPGRTAPLLFVSLPAVTETVQRASAFELPVAKLTLALRDRLIARALGRVAAHELGHYLLQHAGHQPHGLMRPRYSPNELVGDWLEPFKVPRAEQMVVRQEIRAMARYQAAGQQ